MEGENEPRLRKSQPQVPSRAQQLRVREEGVETPRFPFCSTLHWALSSSSA